MLVGYNNGSKAMFGKILETIGVEGAKYVWRNRKAIGRAYHHWVKHKIMLDGILDLSEEHPDHPANKEARANGSNTTSCTTDP